MLEDKKRATDWEATNEAIEEQVARESYLQWLRDQEKQARQVWLTSSLSWEGNRGQQGILERATGYLSCSRGQPLIPDWLKEVRSSICGLTYGS